MGVSVALVVISPIVTVRVVGIVKNVWTSIYRGGGAHIERFIFCAIGSKTRVCLFKFVSQGRIGNRKSSIFIRGRSRFGGKIETIVFLQAAFPMFHDGQITVLVGQVTVVVRDVRVKAPSVGMVVTAIGMKCEGIAFV